MVTNQKSRKKRAIPETQRVDIKVKIDLSLWSAFKMRLAGISIDSMNKSKGKKRKYVK